MLDSDRVAGAPEPSCIFSPKKYASRGAPRSALYLYAENAPGRTEMKPKTDSSGLSRMLDILYLWAEHGRGQGYGEYRGSGVSGLFVVARAGGMVAYSKFCAATKGLIRFEHTLPRSTVISPQAPPTFSCLSNSFQRW